jgi:hypothetical protein
MNFDFYGDFASLINGSKQGHLGLYLYEGNGAALWEDLAENEPAYTVSRSSRQLTELYLSEIASTVPCGMLMIDLGPGVGKSLMSGLNIAKAIRASHYRIEDFSTEVLAAERIARLYLPKSVGVLAVAADIFRGNRVIDEPAFVHCSGATIGNLINDISDEFPIDKFRSSLQCLLDYAKYGWLLLTFDTMSDPFALHLRYRTPKGAKFIHNIIYRAANEFPWLDLEPSTFSYAPVYMPASGQVAHVLTATARQEFGLGVIKEGQRFHIVSSYKIQPDFFEAVVHELGYSVQFRSLDHESGTAVYLLKSPKAPQTFKIPARARSAV